MFKKHKVQMHDEIYKVVQTALIHMIKTSKYFWGENYVFH